MTKPRLFIASSVEGLTVARLISANLDHEATVTIWPKGTFRLGSNALDDLVKKASEIDFAIFVFTPDDVAIIREEATKVVRDNVLFELGLFIGALGKHRCYMVTPRNTDMHLPSDLIGVTGTDYDSNRDDGDLASALNYPCTHIRDEIARHGPISRSTVPGRVKNASAPLPADLSLSKTDIAVLAVFTEIFLSYSGGISFVHVNNSVPKTPSSQVSLSVIKLMKLGYVEKFVDDDSYENGQSYSYGITEAGVEVFLASHSSPVEPTPRPVPAPTFKDMDDEIPF